MGFLEDVAERLVRRSIPYELDATTLIVRPRDERGFTVSAASCFVFGLTTRCRLEVTRRRGMACAWTLEAMEEGVWQEDSTTGLLLVPWWAKKSYEYLQNDWTEID